MQVAGSSFSLYVLYRFIFSKRIFHVSLCIFATPRIGFSLCLNETQKVADGSGLCKWFQLLREQWPFLCNPASPLMVCFRGREYMYHQRHCHILTHDGTDVL